MLIENEEDIARYYKLKKNLELIQEQMSVMMTEPKSLLRFLQPGRLVTVNSVVASPSICSKSPSDQIGRFTIRLVYCSEFQSKTGRKSALFIDRKDFFVFRHVQR